MGSLVGQRFLRGVRAQPQRVMGSGASVESGLLCGGCSETGAGDHRLPGGQLLAGTGQGVVLLSVHTSLVHVGHQATERKEGGPGSEPDTGRPAFPCASVGVQSGSYTRQSLALAGCCCWAPGCRVDACSSLLACGEVSARSARLGSLRSWAGTPCVLLHCTRAA